MDEFLCLLLYGLDDFRVGVTGRNYCDTAHEIQKAVAIHIPYLSTFAVIHHERISARIGWGDDIVIALDQRLSFLPG